MSVWGVLGDSAILPLLRLRRNVDADAGRRTQHALCVNDSYDSCERKRHVELESPSKCARWPLLRVPAGQSVLVELLSGDWIRLTTHYVGRTVLCPQTPDCPLCDLLPTRAFWYLPALREPGRRPVLLELSAQASSDLEQVAKFAAGSVGAGVRLMLSRRTAKSPIRSEAEGFAPSPRRTNVDEWGSLLMAVFCCPPLRPAESISDYGSRIQPQLLARAEVAAARVRSGAEKGVRSR
jgi:hypothetical protein